VARRFVSARQWLSGGYARGCCVCDAHHYFVPAVSHR
jgi:hypothetical protein